MIIKSETVTTMDFITELPRTSQGFVPVG